MTSPSVEEPVMELHQASSPLPCPTVDLFQFLADRKRPRVFVILLTHHLRVIVDWEPLANVIRAVVDEVNDTRDRGFECPI